MKAPPLSKSSGSSLHRRTAFDTTQWEPGYSVRWRCASDDLAVAEWRCNGTRSGVPNAEEVTQHFEINLQRCGWHVRSAARRQYFIDPLHHSIWPADSGYRLSQNTGHPQAATLLFVARHALEEMIATVKGASSSALRRMYLMPVHLRSNGLVLEHARLLATPVDDVLAIEENALALTRRFLAEAAGTCDIGSGGSPRHLSATNKARSFILNRYREPLSLAVIAGAAEVSPSRLSEIFPRIVGMPVWRYVQRLRLQAAAYAVLDGAEDLARLALDLGFSSHSHFTQAFRAEFKQTPSRVRNGAPVNRLITRALTIP